MLALCGIGSLRAAITTSALLAHCPTESENFLIANFGLAGAESGLWKLGQSLLIHRVTEESSGRSCYPERGVRTEWSEAPLYTVDEPAWGRDKKSQRVTPPPLFDMEGYGFCVAAERFLNSSQIVVGKVVSDYVDAQKPPIWDQLVQAVETDYRVKALEFLDILRRQAAYLAEDPRSQNLRSILPWVEELNQTLSATLRLTVHQGRELRTALKAFALHNTSRDRSTKACQLRSEFTDFQAQGKAERSCAHRRVLESLKTI